MLKNLYSLRKLQSFACLTVVVCLISSCSSAFDFQKRRYTRGYHFSTAHSPHKVERKTSTKTTKQASKEEVCVVRTAKTDSIPAENAVALVSAPERVLNHITRHATMMANTRPVNQFAADPQPIKISHSSLQKQHKADVAKKGAVGLLLKIVLVCVLIVLAVLVIIIIGAS